MPAQEVAVTKTAVPVFREGRVVRYIAFEAEPAEPAIGEVQVDLVAQPALGPDPEAVADDQHAHHQLRVDRGPTDLAVERSQVGSQARQIRNAVDGAEQMFGRDVPLQAELVEQRFLRYPPFAHHLAASIPRMTESGLHTRSNADFFNEIRQKPTLATCREADTRLPRQARNWRTLQVSRRQEARADKRGAAQAEGAEAGGLENAARRGRKSFSALTRSLTTQFTRSTGLASGVGEADRAPTSIFSMR